MRRTAWRTASVAVMVVAASVTVGGTGAGALATCRADYMPADAPNLPTLMAACPSGTTFTFSAGTYRLTQQLAINSGDSVVGAGSGARGTRFKGSRVVSRWKQSGTEWVHTGDTNQVGIMPDPCNVGTACDYQDWLYRDGTWLTRVLSPCPATLASGAFCIDYAAGRMFLGGDPTGHTIEYATVTPFLIGWRFPNVTVEHLSYSQFATNGGGIVAGAGWLVDDVHGHHNHSCGISALKSTTTNPATVQNSTFDDNGYEGWCDPGDGMTISGNQFTSNNQLGFAHGGGVNLFGAQGGIIESNSIHDNLGTGIRLNATVQGTGSTGVTVRMNSIVNNAGDAIRLQWSCGNVVASNTVTGNGGRGIDVSDSSGNTISANVVSVPSTPTGTGIRIFADGATGSNNCGPKNDARNNTASGNDVTMGTVATGGNYGNINGTVSVGGGLISGESFTADTYHVPNGDCTVRNWLWSAGGAQYRVGFTAWQSVYRQDVPPAGSCGQ